MPVKHVRVTLTDDPTESGLQHVGGLVEKIQVHPNGLTNLGVKMIEYQTDGDGDQVPFDISENPDIDAKDSWQPVAPTTLPDGTAGEGEAHIPVRSPWTIEVSGASSGEVDVWVTFDQG